MREMQTGAFVQGRGREEVVVAAVIAESQSSCIWTAAGGCCLEQSRKRHAGLAIPFPLDGPCPKDTRAVDLQDVESHAKY